MFNTDWHIHSEASYDAHLTIPTLIAAARGQGIVKFGITDHANFNDPSFKGNILTSKGLYEKYRPECEELHLGVEFTPVEKPLFDYIEKNHTREGYVPVAADKPYALELALSMDEMKALGIEYSIGAAHWRLDVADRRNPDLYEPGAIIREWHRQQMYLVNDPRVSVLGHPWWFSGCNAWKSSDGRWLDKPWFADFSVIPRSMHDELGAAMLQRRVSIEANLSMIVQGNYSESFFRQYAEYLRYMFEKGIPMVYGSDCHGPEYFEDMHEAVEKALSAAGFACGDFSEPHRIAYQ